MIYADANILIRLLEGTPIVRAPIKTRFLPLRGTGRFLATSRLSRLECRCKPLRDGDGALLTLYEALFAGPEDQLVDITADVVEKATHCEPNSGSRRRTPFIWPALSCGRFPDGRQGFDPLRRDCSGDPLNRGNSPRSRRSWPLQLEWIHLLTASLEGKRMSKLHLRALEEALARRGWRIANVHPGDDYCISGIWVIQQSGQPSLFLDFDGMDADADSCLPIEKSYGCQVRGRSASSLYFRKINKRRLRWEQELAAFVRVLGDEENG